MQHQYRCTLFWSLPSCWKACFLFWVFFFLKLIQTARGLHSMELYSCWPCILWFFLKGMKLYRHFSVCYIFWIENFGVKNSRFLTRPSLSKERNENNTVMGSFTITVCLHGIIPVTRLTCHWDLLLFIVIWGRRSRWSPRPSGARSGWAAIILIIFLPF